MSIKLMNWVWSESRTSGSLRLMLLALADQANDQGVCWPAISTLAKKCNCSRDYAGELLKKLEDARVLVISYDLGHSNRYTLDFSNGENLPDCKKTGQGKRVRGMTVEKREEKKCVDENIGWGGRDPHGGEAGTPTGGEAGTPTGGEAGTPTVGMYTSPEPPFNPQLNPQLNHHLTSNFGDGNSFASEPKQNGQKSGKKPAQKNQKSDAAPPETTENDYELMVERVTAMMIAPSDSETIDEWREAGVTEQDIVAAIAWRKANNIRRAKRVSDLLAGALENLRLRKDAEKPKPALPYNEAKPKNQEVYPGVFVL